MHHYHSRKAPVILWICSANLVGIAVGLTGGLIVGACGLILSDYRLLVSAVWLLGPGLAGFGLHLLLSRDVRCPLCHGALLQSSGCSRHVKARRLLGSFRLGVVVPVLSRLRFRCPYCGEPCGCGLRGKSRHKHHGMKTSRDPALSAR